MMVAMGGVLDDTGEVASSSLVADLHRAEYGNLVRLARLLLDDLATSEEVVQDAFVAFQLRWRTIREPDKAAAWLRSAVLNGARSQLRKRRVRERLLPRGGVTDGPPADRGALAADEHRRVVEALRQLPRRQQEALVLRFYLELNERETAEAMGVSAGSVKTHVHRGLAALTPLLEEDDR
jgi:RNA polymerase sigma-70 factor (sigma-E family)